MTERQRIRRNAIATLRRAYTSDAQSALRAFLRYDRSLRGWGSCGITADERAGQRVERAIWRAKLELASIGLVYYLDAGEICTRECAKPSNG
jgi:hypothetical protein